MGLYTPAEAQSLAQQFASLPAEERSERFRKLSPEEASLLFWDWKWWARPKQLAPPGDWSTWLIRAGRGFGKTRAGAGWLHGRAMQFPGSWHAIVARTPGEARNTIIEGPSGIIKTTPPWERPMYQPSIKRLSWPNGSWATIYSDENPEELRGFSGLSALLDEFGKFRNPQACWDMLNYGMREASADQPRRMITTTPRPIPILKAIEADRTTVTTWGTSYENQANLDTKWYLDVIVRQEGTRLGRQEISAEYLGDAAGALWSRASIDKCRIAKDRMPLMRRIVVSVDPATKDDVDEMSMDEEAAETGITVTGLGVDGNGYLLEDISGRYTPREWGQAAVEAYRVWKADLIIGEGNQGGAMVRYVIETIDKNANFKMVHAKHGKQARAEPIASLSERSPPRWYFVGTFPELEDQLTTWEPMRGMPSPDRLDAMVWGGTELMISGGSEVFPTIDSAIAVKPVQISSIWPRVSACTVWGDGAAILWGAFDRASETLYLYEEAQFRRRPEMPVLAASIKKRGAWIPCLFDVKDDGRTDQDGEQLAADLAENGVTILDARLDMQVAISKIIQRIGTDQFRVFEPLERWRAEYRTYRRDEDGELAETGIPLLKAAGLIVQHGRDIAITERRAESDAKGFDPEEYRSTGNSTGY